MWKSVPETDISNSFDKRPITNLLCVSAMHDQGSRLQSGIEKE
jgi:hypothetical protein